MKNQGYNRRKFNLVTLGGLLVFSGNDKQTFSFIVKIYTHTVINSHVC